MSTTTNPMPTVTYEGRTYKLRSRNTVVPDFTTMGHFDVLTWMIRNTTPRGYSRATNPLAGYGGVVIVRSR